MDQVRSVRPAAAPGADRVPPRARPARASHAAPHPLACAAVIRSAGPKDVDALLALEQQSFSADRLSRRSWRRLVASPSAAVLVEQDEASAELHGAVVVLWRRGGRTARIYSIATATAMRGRGIGQRLLTRAESVAREHGQSRMLAEVRTDNGPSLRLFARGGYREFGRYPAYYEDGTDAVRLARTLSPPPPPPTSPGPSAGRS